MGKTGEIYLCKLRYVFNGIIRMEKIYKEGIDRGLDRATGRETALVRRVNKLPESKDWRPNESKKEKE